MQNAGLIYDESEHYLDHLAPFCSLMGWPLILCEPSLAFLAKKYYPDLEVIEKNILDLDLPPRIVACDPRPLLKAAFPKQEFRSLWLPHGNSDKGWNTFFFEGLAEEDAALVYGQKMVDFLSSKKIFCPKHRIGNFRWAYYEKHRDFYQNILDKELQRGRNFLYAPTWDDSENSNSFWTAFPTLAENIPAEVNLLVKLHPNTRRQFEVRLEQWIGRFENQKNILFIENFPLIYPLLSLCDGYIGDMSSIGYDFLKFNKPMFFLNPLRRDPQNDRGLYLFRCGREIDPKDGQMIMNPEPGYFSAIRSEIYRYTFDDWTKNSIL